MKNIFFKTIVPALILIVTMTGCEQFCNDLPGLGSTEMIIYPFSAVANEYLYVDNGRASLFEKDSLKVLDEDGGQFPFVSLQGESDPRNRLMAFYSIHISPVFIDSDDNGAFTAEKIKNIYLYYNYNTIDTLSLVFKTKKTKCASGEYEYLKVYYKKQIVASIFGEERLILFTLNR